MGQTELGAMIRARMLSGTLPNSDEHQLYGGSSGGANCTCCGRPISPAQVQYNIEIPTSYGAPVSLAMHVPCYGLWLIECGRSSFGSTIGKAVGL